MELSDYSLYAFDPLILVKGYNIRLIQRKALNRLYFRVLIDPVIAIPLP